MPNRKWSVTADFAQQSHRPFAVRSLFAVMKSATVACDRWCEITCDAIYKVDKELWPSNTSRMAIASSLADLVLSRNGRLCGKRRANLTNLLLNGEK
jgi:hypothetical protein